MVPALAALALVGCSLSSQPRTMGYAETGGVVAPAKKAPKRTDTVGLGGDPSAARDPVAGAKVAALNTDRAPTGSFDKAPPGALADRDYSQSTLNAEQARDIINAYRKDKGLKPLRLDPTLTAAAKAHSKDLARWDRISHFGSDGSNPWDRVKRAGFNARLAAENVGTGQSTFDEVMRGWRESPGHNKNLLLADAEQMGIALVIDPKTEFKSFWTLVLGSSL
jgi:uncharacterized protein YkwD